MIVNIDNNSKYDVILIAGQSNAIGCGKGVSEWKPTSEIMMLEGEYQENIFQDQQGKEQLELKVADEYFLKEADERKKGEEKLGVFALSFAKRYAEKYLEEGRKVLLVQTSIGGTGFARGQWGDGEILSERLYKMVDQALLMNKENKLVAVLWHQGEHDAFENAELTDAERYDFYYDKLKFLVCKLRKKYDKVPFVSAGFVNQWVKQYVNRCEAVYLATEKVCTEDGNATFIRETFDLKSNDEVFSDGDDIHFSKESCKILGERYFAEYEKMI